MRTPRSEAGFALIEVIVSAMVLALVALAVLSGIDAANGASALEKARAVAANLAEQDQERLRAMPIALLKDPPARDPITVDGVTYTITSETKWITDDLGGEPACGSSATQMEYMQIRTTVTSTLVGKRIKPVTVDSLVAPTTEWAENHGTLAVKVVDRTNAKGVPGIAVSAASSSFTAPTTATNADGCAVFKSVPVGNYTLTLNTPGFMNRDGEQLSQEDQTVVAKTISIATMMYDRATSATAAVSTHWPGSAWSEPTKMPSKARHVSLTNGASVGLHRVFAPATPPSESVTATALFPFAENAYSVFTGSCKYASPDTYKPANTNYFSQTNPLAALKADPAQIQPQQVAVRQPPFNIRIMRRSASSSTAFADGDVVVYAQLQKPAASTDTCAEPNFTLTTKAWPASGWGAAPRSSIGGTNENHFVSQTGSEFDPGMPFGEYEICLRDTVAGRGAKWTGRYVNTAPDGYRDDAAPVDISISGSNWSSTTTCTSF
jgi:type II secretory pathway pseudopilin PulG